MNRKRLIAMGIIMTLSMSTVACGKKEEKTEISKVAERWKILRQES